MGYFDKCIEASFKKRDDGKLIYYPYATIGPKYILSENSEARVRAFLKIYYIVAIIIPMLCVISNHIALAFILLLLVIIFYFIGITLLLSSSEKTEVKV